ncbi:hypothetical protein M3Y98_00733700 [Aphelenchoides besseyi]|nr:hypothetical protein M3Y98_00733700 [Aphelenchoides besseyi]
MTNKETTEKRKCKFQAVDTCYKERPHSQLQFSSSNACKNLHIEQYQPLNLLLNIARAFNNLGAEERRSFREATRRLIGRVDACNPAISDQLKRSMEHLNYRNESICPTKQQVCQQNTAYLYPMYCTFRKHLNCQDRCEDQKFEFQLQLFYATTYALQMISAETNQPLRCRPTHQFFKHTDVNVTLLKPNVEIISGGILNHERFDFCRRTMDLFYNLYSDRDDPQFRRCQRQKATSHDELSELLDEIEDLNDDDFFQFLFF